ncbi:FAD-dependent oxidoreductase [Spirosoma endbachense]|uniref:FAD-dependent oxidoreductase n=1 Tax=Spirosoma endbachense TaxID=2666025 RepID=A0A6P1VUI3_9BACT|nr:FAD-dependent oxidoreductase [Spirosoma endbachense]QHV95752.1 FAD-dependent oxidoreductase [Spirosoma endbachense]
MIDSSSTKVVIIGGGVAGLSAAHELLKRGYEVTIVEKSESHLGGKARSVKFQPSNTNFFLPAEHGFRFFPGFYGNITRTMKEIKLSNNKTVFDNLTRVEYYTFLFTDGRKPIDIPVSVGQDIRRMQWSKAIKDFQNLREAFKDGRITIKDEGRNFFTERLFQLFTSCEERYITEYERIPWSEFIEADNEDFGKDYKKLLAEGLTKNLVACRADKACTRTGGKILSHMIWQIVNPFGGGADRVLNAPTNDSWLIPWVDFLKREYKNNFKIIQGKRVIELEVKGKSYAGDKDTIQYITVNDTNNPKPDTEIINGEIFIAAAPVERLYSLLNRSPAVSVVDPTLKLIDELQKETEWMNGIIFYLNIDVEIANGHVTIADTDFAITIFSQTQYWQEYLKSNPLPEYNGKQIKSVFSVILSNWNERGVITPKPFKEMTHQQVIDEVWNQIKQCTILNQKNKQYFKLTDSDCFLPLTYLDESIVSNRNNRGTLFNKEPLLVNTIVTHSLRPEAHTRVNNLLLASDFVSANSDLADMDTANEAARKAVNNILFKSGRKNYCKTATYVLPSLLGLFSLARKHDKVNYLRGLPWKTFKPLYLFFHYSFLFITYILRFPKPVIIICVLLYLILLAIMLVANRIISVFFSLFYRL